MDYCIKTHLSHKDEYVLPNILCSDFILIGYEHSSCSSFPRSYYAHYVLTLVNEEQALDSEIPLCSPSLRFSFDPCLWVTAGFAGVIRKDLLRTKSPCFTDSYGDTK